MSDFKAQMHQIQFRFPLGLRRSAPDPAGGAYNAPTDPLAVFKGSTFKGREGKEGGGEEKGEREGERRGGKGGEGWTPSWGVWIRQWDFRQLGVYSRPTEKGGRRKGIKGIRRRGIERKGRRKGGVREEQD